MPVDHRIKSRAVVSIAAAAIFAAALAGRAAAQSSDLSPADPPPRPEVSAAAALGTTTPTHVVSLRAGPNGDTPVIGTLRPGDQLEILAVANYGWTEVRSPAGTGWAYGSYLASGINPGGISPVAAANPTPETGSPSGSPYGVSPPPDTRYGVMPVLTGAPSSQGLRTVHGIVSP